jgi:hypothetical protein
MTAEPPADRVGSGTVVNENAADHVGPAFDDIRASGRATVLGTPGPHHLAHFSGSVFDFDVDVLSERARSGCRRTGQQLCVAFWELDQTLQRVRSGALIRTVLHTDRGACYCNSIVPGQCVVAVVFDRLETAPGAPLSLQRLVRACDMAVAELVNAQRDRLSQGSQNPGGFRSYVEEVPRPVWGGARKAHIQHWPSVALADHYTEAQPAAEPVPASTVAAVEEAFTGAIDPADLHYVALCVQGSTVLSVDCLDDGELGRFFTQITVADRRTFYGEFGHSLEFVAGRLARVAAAAIGSRLLRAVLDVEQGAIYYYRLELGKYLVGVTLDQARVLNADDRMARLAVVCRNILGGHADNAE